MTQCNMGSMWSASWWITGCSWWGNGSKERAEREGPWEGRQRHIFRLDRRCSGVKHCHSVTGTHEWNSTKLCSSWAQLEGQVIATRKGHWHYCGLPPCPAPTQQQLVCHEHALTPWSAPEAAPYLLFRSKQFQQNGWCQTGFRSYSSEEYSWC